MASKVKPPSVEAVEEACEPAPAPEPSEGLSRLRDREPPRAEAPALRDCCFCRPLALFDEACDMLLSAGLERPPEVSSLSESLSESEALANSSLMVVVSLKVEIMNFEWSLSNGDSRIANGESRIYTNKLPFET